MTTTTHFDFIEKDIERFERRIERIRSNPDPRKLESTLLRYELERDKAIQRLTAWKEGTPIAWAYGGPSRLLGLMGFHVVEAMHIADRWFKDAPFFFDIVRKKGYPDQGCDRTLIPVVAAEEGYLPPPTFVVGQNRSCDAVAHSHIAVARYFNCPTFHLDVPLGDTEDELRYLTDQLWEMVRFIEREIPRTKPFDEAELAEKQRHRLYWMKILREIYKFRMTVPCPIAARDAFRNPAFEAFPDDPERVSRYWETYRDELKERVEAKQGAIEEEKLRFSWVCSGPFYADPYSWLEEHGVVVPLLHTGLTNVDIGLWSGLGDEEPYGRKLTPIEEEARFMMNTSWGGLGKKWATSIVETCRAFSIDGVVYFMQIGCTTAQGTGRLVANIVEREVGIPTLLIEGRNISQDGYDEPGFLYALEEFIGICLEREKAHRME